jgi:hypothetical protein
MNVNSNPSDDQSPQVGEPVVMNIRQLSQQQLMQLGVSQIAYIKPVDTDGGVAFAIHAADGTPMAIAGDREVAVAAIRQHEMVPALVH